MTFIVAQNEVPDTVDKGANHPPRIWDTWFLKHCFIFLYKMLFILFV